MLNTKKFGDIAFRDKDFKSAIDYYSKVCTYSIWGSLLAVFSVEMLFFISSSYAKEMVPFANNSHPMVCGVNS